MGNIFTEIRDFCIYLRDMKQVYEEEVEKDKKENDKIVTITNNKPTNVKSDTVIMLGEDG